MRVLEVNKFLFGGGGAETMTLNTASLLREHEHEVALFTMSDTRNLKVDFPVWLAPHRSYDAAGSSRARARDAAASIYSVSARRALASAIREWRPDVAHLHNVYHQLSLSVCDALKEASIPVIMTVHDYKPVCPNYKLYTEGEVCHRCVGNALPVDVVRHACIKQSRLASAVALIEAAVVRARRLYGSVDRFVSPSQHVASVLIAGGIPRHAVEVIPNFIPSDLFTTSSPAVRAPRVLYFGRLEEEKGVGVLLEAANALASVDQLLVAGRGAMHAEVERAAADGKLTYLGLLEWQRIRDLLDTVSAVVVPSLWEENCPMVVLEAGARGCPVICSGHGGFAELVTDGVDGLTVPANDAQALASAIGVLLANPELVESLGRARLERTRRDHGAELHYQRLERVLREVVR